MPLVQVSVRAGRSPEKIRAMIGAVTDAVAESLESPKGAIRVIVTEVPWTHWATGGRDPGGEGRAAARKERVVTAVEDAETGTGTGDSSGIHDLRSAIEMLKKHPGQYRETDHPVNPIAQLAGVYKKIGAGGTVPRRPGSARR